MKKIRIGTSGYSFQDWRGAFYPQDIKTGEMLNYYQTIFDTVEINSTYYNIPNRAVFYHLDKKTGEDFQFVVKTHKNVTHKRSGNPDDLKKVMDELLTSIEPLIKSGKLAGLLAQFPFSFKLNSQSLTYLKALKQCSEEFPLFTEFRHESWLRDDIHEFLRENGVGYVNVDEPQLPGLMPPQEIVTTDKGYVRFHGRNAESWWHSSPEGKESGHTSRYDYIYSELELTEWANRIIRILKFVDVIYVFFNNCVKGQAVTNALYLKGVLEKLIKGQVFVK